MLWLRLEEILIGAVIAVAAAWFVLPVRSIDAMRRRIANVLALLSDAFDPATPAREPGELAKAIERMNAIAPAFRAGRWLTRYRRVTQPADWADTLAACQAPAESLIAHGQTPPAVRKAIGLARKTMRDPEAIVLALADLHLSMIRQTPVAMPPVAERTDGNESSRT